MSPPSPRILIVVADGDLAKALVTGLQACGLTCEIYQDLTDISAKTLQDRQALLVDAVLLSAKPQEYVASLRAADWAGLIALLAEDCEIKQSNFEPQDNVAVLTKPFGKSQLLNIAQRLQLSRP